MQRDPSRFRLQAATVLLGACLLFFLGFAWDIQWHRDVGPDTFFTAPHLVLYSGAALGGLVSLYVAVVTTLRYRRGETAAGESVRLPGLRAPLGFAISGLGAAAFLLSGLYDLYWHSVFGFDVTLLSPPHFGLFFSGVIMSVGTVYAFATEAGAAGPGRRTAAVLGLTFGQSLILANLTFFLAVGVGDQLLVGPFVLYSLLAAALIIPGLLVPAVCLRSLGVAGGATLTGLWFTLLRGVVWVYAPWATGAYARSLGFGYKADALHFGAMGMVMPAFLCLAGLIIDLSLGLGRRVRLPGWLPATAAAAAAAVINHLLDPRWLRFLAAAPAPAEVQTQLLARLAAANLPTLALIPLLAALLGWAASRLGTALRHARDFGGAQ